MKTLTVNGKNYKAEEQDMSKFPNLQKFTARTIFLEGARGGKYILSQKVSGGWDMQAFGASRLVSIRFEKVHSVIEE